MKQYIDKSAVIAEIESKFQKYWEKGEESDALQDGNAMYWGGVLSCLNEVKTLIDTLEVKAVDTWHLQEKENIYDAVKHWGHYTFACIMKDGTIQRFNGFLDEDCEGHISVHIDGVNDDYDNVDDIVKWIEYT